MEKRVTMAMIAAACQTSIGTVDRALNNRADINPETKRTVLAAAQKLGYKTNKFAGALSRKKRIRLAFIYPEIPEGFFGCIRTGVAAAEAELQSFGIEIETLHFDAHDPATELKLLASLDAAAYDGIALNPQDAGCSRYVDQFVSGGTPVVTFNNDLPASKRLFYIGEDAEQSGRIGGDILGALMGGAGGVTVMGNFVHVMPFFERFEGFCTVIHHNYPDITIYSCADCRLDTDLTVRNIKNLLDKTPEIRGIFCAGYFSTIGAAEALRQMGRQDILLVGCDVSPETSAALRSGVCKVLLYQNPYQQGYQTAQLLARHILEGWVPVSRRLLIETRIVFRQNIENYEHGVMQWDQSIL